MRVMLLNSAKAVLPMCLLLAAPAFAQTASAPRHPLDPLTGGEIETAARVVKAAPQFPAGGAFATIVLKEPAKEAVLGWAPGAPRQRTAFPAF